MSKSISDRIKNVLTEQLGVDAEHVTESTALVEDLGADSLDLVEIVIALENEFGFEITDAEADKLDTVGDILKFIQAREES